VPGPVALAPEVIEIHEALLVAAHWQPASDVTVTEPEPPVVGITSLRGLISKVQLAADWLTATFTPFNVISPCRGAGAGLGVTCTWMSAAPCPDDGVSVTQFTLTDACQAHSAAAETVTLVLPPAATIGSSGVRATSHFTGEGPVDVVTADWQLAKSTAPSTSARSDKSREGKRLITGLETGGQIQQLRGQ